MPHRTDGTPINRKYLPDEPPTLTAPELVDSTADFLLSMWDKEGYSLVLEMRDLANDLSNAAERIKEGLGARELDVTQIYGAGIIQGRGSGIDGMLYRLTERGRMVRRLQEVQEKMREEQPHGTQG